MKILITGASGFIGSFLFQNFLNSGEDVYGVVRKKPIIPFLKDIPLEKSQSLEVVLLFALLNISFSK